jgi:formylglycine-generating enzyme required for sulfatase activity
MEIEIRGINYTFQGIPKGEFVMGANDFLSNAAPPHRVIITSDFYMLETPVTQRMWETIMGNNILDQMKLADKQEEYGVGPDFPMYYVNWYEVCTFMQEFSKVLKEKGLNYEATLPTESEWEYACRAGTYTPYSWGDGLNGTQANCNGNYPYGMYVFGPFLGKCSPVKTYSPNQWGLYDMHGNVWEWCYDNYQANYYENSPVCDPTGPENAEHKVIRGGGWRSFAWCCRSAFRDSDPPNYRGRTLGFRIVLK